MDKKQIALLFVFLFSSEYVLGAAAAVYGPYGRCRSRCPKRRIVRRMASCTIKPELKKKLDDCFERVRVTMSDSYDMDDHMFEEYEMNNGVATGFRNFQVKSYKCVCGRNLVRIFVEISFLRILISFVLNLLDHLLGGLLGSLGSALSRVLGNVVNLLVRVLALDIRVEIVILQRFIPGTKCVVESYKVSRLTNIQLLGLELRPIAEILSPILTPVLDLLLGIILNGKVKEVFVREIQNMVITRSEVIC